MEIQNFHTNIVKIEKNTRVVYEKPALAESHLESFTDRSILNVEEIYEFAKTVDLEKVESFIKRQIKYNMAMAGEGMKGGYGVNIGAPCCKRAPNVFTK